MNDDEYTKELYDKFIASGHTFEHDEQYVLQQLIEKLEILKEIFGNPIIQRKIDNRIYILMRYTIAQQNFEKLRNAGKA